MQFSKDSRVSATQPPESHLETVVTAGGCVAEALGAMRSRRALNAYLQAVMVRSSVSPRR